MSGILNFKDAVNEWDDFHRPWQVGSWKDKVQNAEFGSPFHGLRAGLTLHELMSPSVHNWDRLQDYRDNGSDGILSRSRDQFHDYTKEAWDNNWPVLAAFAGGAAAGGGGGSAAGGASGGSAAGSGMSLSAGDAAALEAANASAAMSGTSGMSASSGMGMSAPAQGFNNETLQRRVAMQRRLQQLRQKPRKTLAEQQELQELMRNSQGLL
jgi:hypothetical protein